MIKIGIIGCGKITEVRHAPEYNENPNCSLTAFYDVIPEKAQAFAKQYNGRAYTSIEELLASDVDAVSVCVANIYHADVTVRALKSGKHVLCEKPMATTLKDCIAMLQAEKESKKFLMIGQNQRLSKAHVKAKEILDSGELGKLITFQTNFCHPGPEGWTGTKNTWFFDKRMAAYGAMMDLGIHKTDLIYYLTGQKIIKTSAVLTTLDKKQADGLPITVDDNAFCIYTLENGAVGTLHVGWTNYGREDNSTRLYCSEGVIRMYDDPKFSLILERNNGEVVPYELDLLTSNKEQTSGCRTSTGVIDAFVDSIITGNKSFISADSVIPSMKTIFANIKSNELGQSVLIE
jgi:predicted dehydrogenase